MSKANRRRQRPGNQPTSRPTGTQSASQPSPSAGAGGPSSTGAGSPTSAGGTPPVAGAAGATARPATPRPTGTGSRPSSTAARHGRRERQRTTLQAVVHGALPDRDHRRRGAGRRRSPRCLRLLLGLAAGLRLLDHLDAGTDAVTQPQRHREPRLRPARHGQQPRRSRRQGDLHVLRPGVGIALQPPGVAGPIPARVYGPGDNVIPQGWIHNLEHGGMVILYQGTSEGATPEGQAQMRAFYEAFPPAQNCGPVIARFDQMSSPFQAILWGRVLPLQTFDEARIKAFWEQWGGRTNPEKGGCPTPNQSLGADASAASRRRHRARPRPRRRLRRASPSVAAPSPSAAAPSPS